MTKEEWNIEFQVLNGRQPTVEEIAKAQESNFGAQIAKESSLKTRFTLIHWNAYTIIRVAILIVLAIFGYVIGYLFT